MNCVSNAANDEGRKPAKKKGWANTNGIWKRIINHLLIIWPNKKKGARNDIGN